MIKELFTKESKTIAGAALVIGVASILSRVLGLIRDRLLVSHFTIGDQLDAYYASFQLPNFIFALLILGTLSVAFIPVFTYYLANNKKEEAWHIANTVLTVTMIGMGAVCLVLSVAAPLIVRFTAPGFSGEKLALTVHLTRIMMLSPFFFAISAVLSSVLNSYKQFLTVALAPLVYNASLIFGVVYLAKPFGIAGVAYGAIGGAVLHVLIQIPGLISLGMKWKPSFDTGHPGVREIGGLFLPRVFGVDISQISQLIGTIIGTTLSAGAVSLYTLAVNIQAVPVGVFAIPFAIAAFPSMSEAIAKSNRAEFVRIFAATFRHVVFFLAPLTTMAIVLRVHVIRAIIGSRGVSWNDTRLAGAAFALFALSLAFQGLTPLLARSFYAIKNTVVPVVVSGIAVAVNLLVTYGLIASLGSGHGAATAWMTMGLFGVTDVRMLALPIAFTFASVLQVVLLAAILRRKFGPLGGRGLAKSFAKFIVGSLAAAWATWMTLRLMGGIDDVTLVMTALVQATVASAVGFLAYGIVLKLLKSEELDAIIDTIRNKFMGKSAMTMPVQDTNQM